MSTVSLETQQSFFNNPALFSLRSLYQQSIVNCHCHVHMHGDVSQHISNAVCLSINI